MPGNEATLYCSFCGKSQYEVRKLVCATDQVAVCDACVNVLVLILREEGIEVPFDPADPHSQSLESILAAIRGHKSK